MQNFIDYIFSIILGIIQGITEWLPISSTGHLILAQELTGKIISEDFAEMFNVVIQFGSILAVILLFWNKLFPFTSSKTKEQKKDIYSLWCKIIIAVAPAGIIGLLFDDKIDELFFNPYTVAGTLIIYGVLFIIVENYNKHRKPQTTKISGLSYKTALLIGCFQILALIPGTSRSGATILGAIILGCSRYVAAEFSFFLAVPIMCGASFFKILKHGFDFTFHQGSVLIVGMICAFIVSVFALKFLVGYVKKHDFKPFGYYRIILGIIVLLYFAIKSAII